MEDDVELDGVGLDLVANRSRQRKIDFFVQSNLGEHPRVTDIPYMTSTEVIKKTTSLRGNEITFTPHLSY